MGLPRVFCSLEMQPFLLLFAIYVFLSGGSSCTEQFTEQFVECFLTYFCRLLTTIIAAVVSILTFYYKPLFLNYSC